MVYRWPIACILALACGAASPGPAPPVTLSLSKGAAGSELQTALEARVAGQPGTGIVLGIIDGDMTTVYTAGATGMDRPLDEHTLFEIGSVTKTFTATLLATMVLDHTVALSDAVAKDVPPSVHVPSRDGKRITLLNLATQHSGLPRLPSNLQPADPEDPYAGYALPQLYAFLNGYQLPRDPGASFEYSNLGIALLGDALAYRARTPYPELLRARVLAPLRMNDTAIDLSAEQRTRFAVPHDGDGDVVKPWTFRAIAPAGGLRSSVSDMLKYVRCNLGRGPLAQACIFAQQPRDTFPGNRIGLVWWTGAVRPIVHHGGDTNGFHAAVAIAPDHRKGVVVLTNGGGPVEDVAFHALDPTLPLAPPPPRGVTLDAATLETYAGVYDGQDGLRGLTMTIAHVGNHLTAQLSGQPAARLYASGPDQFFYRIVDAQLEFTHDAAGTINALLLHQNGRTLQAVRHGMTAPPLASAVASSEPTPFPLDVATLDEYAGAYLAGPGAEFIVRRVGDGLEVQLTGQSFYPVFASAKDRFVYHVVDAQLEFTRDADGRISALILHQNGADIKAAKE